jgi:cyclohexyl-isocyanide hydratase
MLEIDPLTRRSFLLALTTAIASQSHAESTQPAKKMTDTEIMAELMRGGAESVFILLYPGFTAMDAMGPEYILSCMMGATVRFIAKTAQPVRTESGFEVTPHLTFDKLPEKTTLFLVPGGSKGTLGALGDKETIDFIRKAGNASATVASVCTGSLLLGAAGLLDGYEATSHWQTLDLLSQAGAKPVKKRVVFDRNRATGAGVTAGLDLALELVRRYRGDLYAKGVQLLGEYDPQPPFPGEGNAATANQQLVQMFNAMHAPFLSQLGEGIRKAR